MVRLRGKHASEFPMAVVAAGMEQNPSGVNALTQWVKLTGAL